MILPIAVKVKDLVEAGQSYVWPRPSRCPKCSGIRIWGHGYVEAYFDGESKAVKLRRYRCPDCRLVIRMKPEGYWPLFQAAITDIRRRIEERIKTGRWPPGMDGSRQRHWLKALNKKILGHLGFEMMKKLMEGFDILQQKGICPVSRSI